jgi:hypothetical protein
MEVTYIPWGPPTEKQLFRYGTQPIYGSRRILEGSALVNCEFPMFAAGRGEVKQGFTRPVSNADTNLYEAKRTPHYQSFDVGGVAWEIRGSKADREMAAAQAFWAWEFMQTRINQGALGSSQVRPAQLEFDDKYRSWEGDDVSVFWFTLPVPTVLPGMSPFDVLLGFGPDATPLQDTMTIRCTLFGTFKNFVEVG